MRWSSAKAYLKPAIQSGKCQVIRGLATKIIIENSQATGVEYTQGNKKSVLLASKEVIISASAINSPKLLLLSGIGPAAELKSKGIKVVANRPGVGKNLQDHLMFRPVYKVKNLKSLNRKVESLFGRFLMGLEYVLNQSGPVTMGASQVCAFTKSDPSRATPNLQFHVQPLSTDILGVTPMHNFEGITPTVANIRPTSRGEINITSNDSRDNPKIKMNYLSTEDDRIVAAKKLKACEKNYARD